MNRFAVVKRLFIMHRPVWLESEPFDNVEDAVERIDELTALSNNWAKLAVVRNDGAIGWTELYQVLPETRVLH